MRYPSTLVLIYRYHDTRRQKLTIDMLVHMIPGRVACKWIPGGETADIGNCLSIFYPTMIHTIIDRSSLDPMMFTKIA